MEFVDILVRFYARLYNTCIRHKVNELNENFRTMARYVMSNL